MSKLDPTGTTLVYSTYLGGNDLDSANGITVDAAGNVYLTGETASADFPSTPGAFLATSRGGEDAFVTKLNATGTGLVYSAVLGGFSPDVGTGIAVDAAGDAYVAGYTESGEFPTTPGAIQASFRGGLSDALVSKLNPTGTTLVYSTYLGGKGQDGAGGIALDATGAAYVVGGAASVDFPTTPGAFQTTARGGGDAFVTKLNATGTTLVYSTFLGGSGDDRGAAIAADGAGNAYVTGQTGSPEFPTTPGAVQTTWRGGFRDAFVSKLNATGTALVSSTFLGGSGSDVGTGIALDAAGSAYVTGQTASADFPTTPGTVQTTFHGGGDAWVARLGPTISLLGSPRRLADTRTTGGPIPVGASRCFQAAGVAGVPADGAVVLNVTAVGQTTDGWLTVYPAGQSVPATSTLNFDPQVYAIANGAIVALGSDGRVCVNVGTVNAAPGSSQIVLDVMGYLLP